MNPASADSLDPAAIAVPEREPPSQPFRGIAPFRFLDQPIFFGRIAESQRLLRLVTMFRGVLLFGDSGCGKSSLLNARFVPEAMEDGYLVERLRVQPKRGAEIVVDRIAVREHGEPPFLPSNLVDSGDEQRTTMSCEQLRERINRAERHGYPLLIFDQFEEFMTLFEVAPRTAAERVEAGEAQERLLNLLAELLVGSQVPVKLLFAFREDYFTKLQKLFVRCRDLTDQSLRLLPPTIEDLPLTIRGPFERNPGMFANPFSPAVAAQLEAELRERSAGGLQNPTEGQIAGLMLWRADDREQLLATRKVQGLLEDFLVQQLEALPPATRSPAVALLSCLVTDGGTRNIVSGSDLLARVTESECVTEEAVAATLDDLVRKTGLVRQEFRDRTPFYQIISEFLIPWIREQKNERARIEAERTLAHERLAAAEKLAEERERAEQKLALQSAEADRLRAQDLAATLRSVRRARTALAILMLFALGGWSFAVLQTRQARRESRRAITERNAADKARETAQFAEDGARTALEQTSKLAVASEQRLRAAGQVLGQTQQTTQDVLDAIHRVGPPADPAASTAWNQVVQKLQETVQRTETGGQQVSADIQLTKQEAATATSTPGWSLYGKLRPDGTWTSDRYFHKDGAALDLPAAGDIIIAETFVNVRKSPSAYDSQQQAWHMAQILGVIAPNQRLKVDEVRRTESAPGDPAVRVWVRAEPPKPAVVP